MRSGWFYILGIITCVMAGTKNPVPNQEDIISAKVNDRMIQIMDSIKKTWPQKDRIIKANRDLLNPKIEAIKRHSDSLQKELSRKDKEIEFYKCMANNPVIIKTEYKTNYDY